MTIEFVNHACIIIEQDNIRLMCDPWLEGSVFNNGWKLITPTQFRYEEFDSITHIWFSHEHPDHFSPPNLKKIPLQYRNKITILFQHTTDKRVIKFCQEAGFKQVIELHTDTWVQLSNNLSILCELFTEGDSWLCLRTPEETFLNTNDCWITEPSQALAIKAKIGKVDVLLNQFSYAFWAGNTDQPALRKKVADEKLQSYLIECEVFQPRVTIPIASFVWFCHAENYFLNDSINTVGMLYDFLQRAATSVKTVVLFPSEKYQLGKEHDSVQSITKWQYEYEKVSKNPDLIHSAKISVEELQKLAVVYLNHLKNENGWIVKQLIKFFKTTYIHLSDHEKTFRLTSNSLEETERKYDDCDISLSSDSLAFCFRFPYGIDTLGVNGRYQRPKNGKYTNFYNLFRIEHLKSRGVEVNFTYLAGAIARKIQEKF
jgi:L-ascorbate metabolism protein UlaG (beta-lactamase superfamily)